jgi:hypothetical protein
MHGHDERPRFGHDHIPADPRIPSDPRIAEPHPIQTGAEGAESSRCFARANSSGGTVPCAVSAVSTPASASPGIGECLDGRAPDRLADASPARTGRHPGFAAAARR